MLECNHRNMQRKDIDIVIGFNHSSDYQYTTAIYSCPDCGLTNQFNDFETMYELEHNCKIGLSQVPKISTSFMWKLHSKSKKRVKLNPYLKKKAR